MWTTDQPFTMAAILPTPGVQVPTHHGRTLTEQMFDVVTNHVSAERNREARGAAEVLAVFINSQSPPPASDILAVARQALAPVPQPAKKVPRRVLKRRTTIA